MTTLRHLYLGHPGPVPLLEPPLGLHEGRVLVPGVVVGEVRVGGRPLCRGGRRGCCCCRGRGGCRLGCCGGCGSLIFREVDGDLDISQRILDK